MNLAQLDKLIKTVCPIDGLDSNGNIHFSGASTVAEKAAGQAVFDANWPIDGIDTVAVADASAVTVVKANAVINYLVTHTPAECAAKVQTDVTNLATAKDMLAHFAQALCVLAKDRLR